MLIRRSNLTVSLADRDAVANAWRHGADAVTLDLGASESRAADWPSQLAAAVKAAGRGGAEVFVRIDKSSIDSDIEAAAVDGLAGLVLTDVQSAADVKRADAAVDKLGN